MAHAYTRGTGAANLDRALEVIRTERTVKTTAVLLGLAGLVLGLFGVVWYVGTDPLVGATEVAAAHD